MNKLRSTLASLAAVALTAGLAAGALAADASRATEPVGVYSHRGHDLAPDRPGSSTARWSSLPEGLHRVACAWRTATPVASGGCNSYFTSYELDGFELTFGPIGSTHDGLPAADHGPRAGLLREPRPGRGLPVGRHPDGAARRRAATSCSSSTWRPRPAIVGSWVAQGINNQQTSAVRQSSAYTSSITADFGAGRRRSPATTAATTTSRATRSTATPSPSRRRSASTMMACRAMRASLSSPQWYFGALAAATTWSVDASGYLELRDADGSLQVQLPPGRIGPPYRASLDAGAPLGAAASIDLGLRYDRLAVRRRRAAPPEPRGGTRVNSSRDNEPAIDRGR